MIKQLSTVLGVALISLALVTQDAEAARRLGGGKSVGMQRESISTQRATPPSTPAHNPAANPSPMQSAPAAAAPQAAPKRSWMGPLAGLAAGLGLAALAAHFGFGEGLATALLIGLAVMLVLAVVGVMMRRRATRTLQPAAAGAPWEAAGNNVYRESSREVSVTPAASAGPGANPVAAAATTAPANIPADFDADGFLRQAKVSFLRLQAAHDTGNLDDIREFTTPEMFGEISAAIMERSSTTQETNVTELNADVIDVAKDSVRHIVSVHFRGTARIDRGAELERIDEIWHIVKPLSGKSGWQLAGIQQMQ